MKRMWSYTRVYNWKCDALSPISGTQRRGGGQYRKESRVNLQGIITFWKLRRKNIDMRRGPMITLWACRLQKMVIESQTCSMYTKKPVTFNSQIQFNGTIKAVITANCTTNYNRVCLTNDAQVRGRGLFDCRNDLEAINERNQKDDINKRHDIIQLSSVSNTASN